MKITEIKTQQFRNLADAKIQLDGGLNVIMGDNGQGKTNLLEAVYLCCIGKSPRTDKDKDMINKNKTQARVKLGYFSRYGEGMIDIMLANGKKHISVNNVPLQKTGELMGYFNAVYFSPDELRLVKAGPLERRRYINIALCQTDKMYYYCLSNYNKTLNQRNVLLKNPKTTYLDTETWDILLAKEGAKIIQKRHQFASCLSVCAKSVHSQLTDNKEMLDISYECQVNGNSLSEWENNFILNLKTNFEKDKQLGFTGVGIHRDDLKIVLNDIDVRRFGSQGQQRTTALSLKIAETEFIKNVTKEYPVLLLDDVLSELDIKRQEKLLTFNPSIQTIITCTHLDNALSINNVKCLKITNGTVT